MILHVREAEYVQGYVIRLRFNDGAEGEVDLRNELSGEFFEPLKKIEEFKKFRVDPNLETIVWKNGAYLAPEFLYEKMNAYSLMSYSIYPQSIAMKPQRVLSICD